MKCFVNLQCYVKQELMTNNIMKKINAVHPTWNGVCN